MLDTLRVVDTAGRIKMSEFLAKKKMARVASRTPKATKATNCGAERVRVSDVRSAMGLDATELERGDVGQGGVERWDRGGCRLSWPSEG